MSAGVGVVRIQASVPRGGPGQFSARWKIHVERQQNGFSPSRVYPTREDLPADVRAALLAWLTGETDTAQPSQPSPPNPGRVSS